MAMPVIEKEKAFLPFTETTSLIVPSKNNQQTADTNLKAALIEGLESSPPYLPSLLLWDDYGIRRFNALSSHPNYYPSRTELDLVKEEALNIAMDTPPGSVIIELGCGSLSKTGIILSAFERLQRPITYYALDVSPLELQTSLTKLSHLFAHSDVVSIRGLHGTYDDCAAWLLSPESQQAPGMGSGAHISFWWLGNSIANMHVDEAMSLLSKLYTVYCESQLRCRFIITSDACADPSTVLRS